MMAVVLGATGYIGSHIAEQLCLAGVSVSCWVREGADVTFLQQLGVDIHVVDFTNEQSLLALLSGADVVCNCIADTRLHIRIDERRKVDVELSRYLFQLCEQEGVKRFIQLSTVMVYGFKRPSTAIDETFLVHGQYAYNQIAIERENALSALAESSTMELLLVRPANAIGRRDTSFMPHFIDLAKINIFPCVAGGLANFSCVDCRDVGRAFVHLTNIERQATGVYLVKSFDMNWIDLKVALEKKLNKKLNIFVMNKRLFMFVAWLIELVYPYGNEPPLTRFSLEVLSTDALFDDTKIKNTGFKALYDLERALSDCIN